MPKKSKDTNPGVAGRRAPFSPLTAQPANGSAKITPAPGAEIIECDNVAHALRIMDGDAASLLGWMIQTGVTNQKDEPYLSFLDVRRFAEDLKVSVSEVMSALTEMGRYVCPANASGMKLRVATLLGWIEDDAGHPETALLWLIPIGNSAPQEGE